MGPRGRSSRGVPPGAGCAGAPIIHDKAVRESGLPQRRRPLLSWVTECHGKEHAGSGAPGGGRARRGCFREVVRLAAMYGVKRGGGPRLARIVARGDDTLSALSLSGHLSGWFRATVSKPGAPQRCQANRSEQIQSGSVVSLRTRGRFKICGTGRLSLPKLQERWSWMLRGRSYTIFGSLRGQSLKRRPRGTGRGPPFRYL